MCQTKFLSLLFLVMFGITLAQRLRCREPEPDTIPSNKLYTDLEDESMGLLPSRHGNHGVLRGVPCRLRNVTREVVPVEDNACVNGYTNDNERSVCPYYYVRNIDNNRIPQVLYEVRCSSRVCQNVQVDQGQERRPECKEMYHYVKVLRRTSCRGTRYQYEQVMEPLAAGCGCFLPSRACHRGEVGQQDIADSANPKLSNR